MSTDDTETARERALRVADAYIERTVTVHTGATAGYLYGAKPPSERLALVLRTAEFLLGESGRAAALSAAPTNPTLENL